MNDEQSTFQGGQDRDKTSGTVTSKAQGTADKLKSTAQKGLDTVRHQAEDRRDVAAQRVRRFGSAIRTVAQDLRVQDEDLIAKYVESFSERIERAADYVDHFEPQKLAQDTTRFARERPAWFFGGAFMLGLAAARFLKSSQQTNGGDFEPQTIPSTPSTSTSPGLGGTSDLVGL